MDLLQEIEIKEHRKNAASEVTKKKGQECKASANAESGSEDSFVKVIHNKKDNTSGKKTACQVTRISIQEIKCSMNVSLTISTDIPWLSMDI